MEPDKDHHGKEGTITKLIKALSSCHQQLCNDYKVETAGRSKDISDVEVILENGIE